MANKVVYANAEQLKQNRDSCMDKEIDCSLSSLTQQLQTVLNDHVRFGVPSPYSLSPHLL
jgi:hypothetical protein